MEEELRLAIAGGEKETLKTLKSGFNRHSTASWQSLQF